MDEALDIGLALVIDRLALGVELDQIVAFDQFRRQRARHEEALRVVGMAHADMAVGVDHVFIGENAVGDDKIAQQVFELAHGASIGSTVATTLGRSTVILRRSARSDEPRRATATKSAIADLVIRYFQNRQTPILVGTLAASFEARFARTSG